MVRRTLALWLVLVLVGSSLVFGAGAPAEKSKPPKEDYYELYKLLVDTIDQVERNYVKEIDRRELIEAAIQGVLQRLDPYSAYINREQISRFRTTVESQFGGIGIQLAPNPRRLTIFSPLLGTPAYRAGLLAGDRIVEIEGRSTAGMRMDEAIRRLKGKPGSTVKMAVVHPGKSEKVEVNLTREIIHIDTVLGDRRREDDTWDFMLDPDEKIGYVRVTAFSRATSTELREVLQRLCSEEMRALILDLRFNPGGLLDSAVEVSDLFISGGRIVSTKGRNTPERPRNAKKEGTFEGFRMVVLVNHYSASASEIVSACLQDHQRAVIMGERTWGKGSVQNVIELEGGKSLLKLTTASYRRPSGKNIHRFHDSRDEQQEWGVTPDKGFELKLSDAEIERLILDRRQRDVIRPKPDEAPEHHEAKHKADQPQPKPDENPAGNEQQPKPKEDPQQPDDETSEDDGQTGDGQTDDGQAAQPDSTPAAEKPEEEEPFVDRQLQMAVDYLTKKLARAE